MDMREIVKKKKVDKKLVSLSKEYEDQQRQEAFGEMRSDDYIKTMAAEAGKTLPIPAGTVVKVGGPVGKQIGNVAEHIDAGSLRSLLRKLNQPEVTKKAEEYIAKEVPLKQKSEGVARMVALLKEKLK